MRVFHQAVGGSGAYATMALRLVTGVRDDGRRPSYSEAEGMVLRLGSRTQPRAAGATLVRAADSPYDGGGGLVVGGMAVFFDHPYHRTIHTYCMSTGGDDNPRVRNMYNMPIHMNASGDDNPGASGDDNPGWILNLVASRIVGIFFKWKKI